MSQIGSSRSWSSTKTSDMRYEFEKERSPGRTWMRSEPADNSRSGQKRREDMREQPLELAGGFLLQKALLKEEDEEDFQHCDGGEAPFGRVGRAERAESGEEDARSGVSEATLSISRLFEASTSTAPGAPEAGPS